MAGAWSAVAAAHALSYVVGSVLASGMGWVKNVHSALVKLVGLVEVLGALGLILPLATGIAPILTPIAAVGLAVTMLGAVITHAILKGSAKAAMMSALLGVLSVVSAVLGFIVL